MAETAPIIPNTHDTPPPTSPGAVLKRCREYHEISLEEAAEATKIGASHLAALENDRIREFASPAHLKGFLRIYGGYLGLNPDDLMRLYEKLYAPEAPVTATGAAAPRKQRRPLRIPWQKLTLPAGLLVMILISSAVINRYMKQERQQPPPPVAAPPPLAAVPVQAPLSSAGRAPVAAKTPPVLPAASPSREEVPNAAPAPQPAEQVKAFILRMKVVGNATLAVSIDGAAPQDYELTAGDVIEWKAERDIVLELSNGGSVEAELNGRTLKPFGPSGKPAYVVVGANGIRE